MVRRIAIASVIASVIAASVAVCAWGLATAESN